MNGKTSWAQEREKATRLFGDATPYEKDDAAIADAFNRHPAAVLAEIARVAQAYADGKIHTPWRALTSRLPRIEQDHHTVDLTTDLRIRQAEAFIRNAGIYCPTETEIRNELFHDSSALLASLEDELADRMLALWHHEQPRAHHAEADRTARAERWKQAHDRLETAPDFGTAE